MDNNQLLIETGHEYVDLGLSVKWATCNIGAETPDGYGRRYIWRKNMKQGYDTTSYNWQGRWRLPTVENFRELFDNCIHEWVEHDDVRGLLFTSTKPGFEGKTIFLRASGLFDIDENGPYEYGMYWTADLFWNEESKSYLTQLLTFAKVPPSQCPFCFIRHDFYPWACVRPVF